MVDSENLDWGHINSWGRTVAAGCNFDFLSRVVIIEGMLSISTWVHELHHNKKRSREEIIAETLQYIGLDWYIDTFKLTPAQLEEGIEILFKGRYSGWMNYCYSAGVDEWDDDVDVDDDFKIGCFKIEPEEVNE